MSANSPLLLSIVGKSGSGKTTLILKLLTELNRRQYKVAVAKNCPHGFELDIKGKDSWKFANLGGKGVFLSSGNKIALLRYDEDSLNTRKTCFCAKP